MTLRGFSCGSCTWVTGRRQTFCAWAYENRDGAVGRLWCSVWGWEHCRKEHSHFYGGEPYRVTRLFR